MQNVIYFSGSHGSGKSTLIKKLAEKDPELFTVYKKLKISQSEDPAERQKLRLMRYYWDALKQDKFSKDNPNKILLCDRCVSSNYAYVKSLFQLGWVTKEQHDGCMMLCENLFYEEIRPKNIVSVNPSLEDTIKNIKKRWKETGRKKWREDNFDYLERVKKNFDELYTNNEANILELNFLDLEKRIYTCYDWIKKTVNGVYP